MDKKYRWKLQIYWQGGWRTILEGDKRTELSEYMESCPDQYEMRIVDTTLEEVKPNGRRRH